MNRLYTVVAMVVLLLSMTACTSFEKSAYVSLESVRAVAEAGMETCADLVVRDKISLEQWQEISGVYVKLQESGALASKAMAAYKETKDEGTARAAINSLIERAEYFIERVEQITGKKLPVALKLLI